MKKYNTATPNIASYVVIRRNDKVAFVLRSKTGWMNGYFGLPSGKVENDESYSAAAIREAKEETGVVIHPKDLRFVHVMHRYEPSSQATDWVDVFFEAVKYSGKVHNAEPHIHSELAWLDPNNLPENTIPSVKAAIEHIQADHSFSEYGWDQVKFYRGNS